MRGERRSSQLEPIPAHSELAARLDLHVKLQEEFVLERELSNLAAQAASMDVALRRQRARHLLEQVCDPMHGPPL